MPKTDEFDLHVLRELEAQPAASQRSLAQRLGVSLGRMNYCLRALSDKGLIKARNFRRSDNKWAYAYVLTPTGAQEKMRLSVSFLQRKIAEYDRLQDEIAQLRREVNDARAQG
jgi:MarR family transcriptional regulator, temperature-dependent positive regulator of motility